MRLARKKGFLPALLVLSLWFPGQAWGVPPRVECAHAPAHLSTFTPDCSDVLDCDPLINVPGFVRIGDPVGAPGDEEPRFFFDEAGAGRFHTELFSRIYNNGGHPAPSGQVTVRLSVKANATGPGDTSDPFTTIGDYVMDIPVMPEDWLTANASHDQPMTKPVCWILGAGELFPKKFLLKAEVLWPQDEAPGNNTLYQFYDLTAEALPADIAFSMDLSGSMAIAVPGGGSRLAVAQDRARMFIDLIEIEDGVPHNRLGLFGFATGMPAAVKSDFTGTWKSSAAASHSSLLSETAVLFPFQEIGSAADRLAGRIAVSDPVVVRPYGCTPVGQGLLRAKSELLSLSDPPGTERSRAIVLFSDGFQNVGPYVNEVPPELCGGPSSLALIHAEETFKNNTPTLPIYSVFFGAESGWAHQLMLDLQAQTGGDYLYYTGTSLELAAAYYQIRHLVASNALLFLEEDGKAVGASPTAAVPVYFDAASLTATVGLAWPVGAQGTLLTVEARPAGGNNQQPWQDLGGQLGTARVDPPGKNRFHDAYRVFRFTPGTSKTWELRVRQVAPGQGTVPYTLAVFARTEEVRLKASLGAEGFAAGKALPIYADLRSAGHPVPNADVRATVTAPARPFSTTLRRYADRLTVDRGAGDQTVARLAAQLQGVLAQEVGSPDLYPVRQLTVTLNDRGQGADRLPGDGVYTGEVPAAETTVAGNYGVIVTATGNRSGVPFERTEKLGSIAAIGPIDPERTEVRFSAPRQLGDQLRAVDVTVLAMDRFGNATFPGAASTITLLPQPGGGTLAGALADDLTSTYSQTLVLAPGEQPAVTLRIDGQDLGSFQPGSKPGAFARFEASVHAGLAVPHGVFGESLDEGPAFAVDATYRFTSYVALRSELGFSLFDDPVGGDRRMIHFVPYLQLRNPVPVWQPYFEAGPGVYDLESAGTAGGFSAGVGVQRQIAPHWRLDLALHGHHAGGGLDATYSQTKIGFQITF